MNTEYLTVNKEEPLTEVITRAADILKAGGLVAFPTETVYGLGANGLSGEAAKRIFVAKGRPSDNPLILHVSGAGNLAALAAEIPANAKVLMEAFWPGPLTLIFRRQPVVPDAVTGGLDTVAVRWPASTVACALIEAAGVPLAAPSANLSGRPSPTCAEDVKADLDGRIDMILDAGACDIGVESTVVDCTTPVPTILRPGGITLEMLEEVLGAVEIDPALAGNDEYVPRAPGMKYTHYAPKAPVVLVEGDMPAAERVLQREIAAACHAGKITGALVSEETARLLPADVIAAVYGPRDNSEIIAANLYTALRSFDDSPAEIIFAEGLQEAGLGLAVMNRLRKACGYNIIRA